MRIVIFVFLSFLVLSEAGKGKKGNQNGGNNGDGTGDQNGSPKGEKVEIHGTVHVKLPKAHPKPTHITVMVKSAAPKADGHEEVTTQACEEDVKEEKQEKDKAHKTYSCKYIKLSAEHHGDKKIKVGARLEASKHLGGKLLHEIKGKGKEKEEAWSLPIAIPENHEVDFNFNLKKEHVHPTIKVIGHGHISVHIKGQVHITFEKLKEQEKGHKKPTYVTIMIKTKTHAKDPRKIKSKNCENEVCHYEANFIVDKEEEGYRMAAHVGAQESEYTSEHTVPKSHKIVQDLTLHLLKGKQKPKLEFGKKHNGGGGGEDGSNGGGEKKSKGGEKAGKKKGPAENPEADD